MFDECQPWIRGQSFIERTYAKTQALRAMLDEEAASGVLIEIDGGVGMGNARALVDAGANVLVAGSSVFKAADPLRSRLGLGQRLNSVHALEPKVWCPPFPSLQGSLG